MKFSPNGIGYYPWNDIIGLNPSIINVKDIFIEVFGGDIIGTLMK